MTVSVRTIIMKAVHFLDTASTWSSMRRSGSQNRLPRRPLERTEHPILRQGDMPQPVPERVANPNVREDRAVQDFPCNLEMMHCPTCADACTRAWFDYCRSVFPQSMRKAGPNVDLYNVSTHQCSILFNNMGSLTGRVNF